MIAHQTPKGGYDFDTTSWTRPFQNAFAHFACVQNNDKTRQLFVDWHIPTVTGVILPSDSITKPRVFATDNTASINGCLIYGNSRSVMKVEFLGHHDDVDEAGREGDCSELRAQKSTLLRSSQAFPSFVVEGRMTVPSNIKDPEHTLIRFVYAIGLTSENPAKQNYGMLFNYAAAPASTEDFKGSLKDLTIRPTDKRVDQAWKKAGLSGQLKEAEGNFNVLMDLPNNFSLVQQNYVVYDQNNSIVGEIPAPFLVSQ
jgi:hypothetical protein